MSKILKNTSKDLKKHANKIETLISRHVKKPSNIFNIEYYLEEFIKSSFFKIYTNLVKNKTKFQFNAKD